MQKWHHIFHKSTGLSPYVWVVFYILPFYFFSSSQTGMIVLGIALILAFFICYVLSFQSKGWSVYLWTGLQIAISITMALLFGYVYFSLFLAFFIGNIQNKIGFITLYTVHLITTIATVNYGMLSENRLFLGQLPFVLVCLIAVVLLPVTTYNRNRHGKLTGELEDANKRIEEFVKLEERQRIARDLHDTLGQKLSLIGLKSDLAGKLIAADPERARAEVADIRQTARTALKEVREMVMQMRGAKVEEELVRVSQLLQAAEIRLHLEGNTSTAGLSPITETVLAMCLKEAVTNVVKHSGASDCWIKIEPQKTGYAVQIRDNGRTLKEPPTEAGGHGLRGMRERLEFVNGRMALTAGDGIRIDIQVPYGQPEREKEVSVT